MHLKYISSTRIFSSRFTKIFLLFCACAFIGSSIGKIVSHNTARQTAASAQSSNWGLSFQEVQCLFCWRYRRKENLSHLWRRLWKWKYSCYFGCTEKTSGTCYIFCGWKFHFGKQRSDQTNGNGRAYCRQSYYDAPGYVKNFHKRIFSERIIRCRKNLQGNYRKRNDKILPPPTGHLQYTESVYGQRTGISHIFLEPCLCRLVPW